MEAKTMTKKRKNYTPEAKIKLLREHLVEGTPVSEICDRNQLQPTVFYRWQRQFFENGALVFERGKDRETTALKKKITKLEEKLVTKNEVLGELMEDHIELKKSLGEI
jgi:transposase